MRAGVEHRLGDEIGGAERGAGAERDRPMGDDDPNAVLGPLIRRRDRDALLTCAKPPTGGQASVQAPPETVAVAPDVVFDIDHAPSPRKNGSPIAVPTAGRVSSSSLIHTRMVLAVSSINDVSVLAKRSGSTSPARRSKPHRP